MKTTTNACKGTEKKRERQISAGTKRASREEELSLKLLESAIPFIRMFSVEEVQCDGQSIHATMRSVSDSAVCPSCGSRCTHSRGCQPHTVTHLPVGGKSLRITLLVRKYVCTEGSCSRKYFMERLDPWVGSHARYTDSAKEEIAGATGLTSSVKASAMMRSSGIDCSPNTCTRHFLSRCRPEPPAAGDVGVIGVDDFAMRRGHTYGTVFVDHLSHRITDMIPTRDSHAVAAALGRLAPDNAVITRDRGLCYIAAVREGCPTATEVADRFHLTANLAEQVYPHIIRDFREFRKGMPASAAPPPALGRGWLLDGLYGQILSLGTARDRRRMETWREAHRLLGEHPDIRQTAERMGVGAAAVRKALGMRWEDVATGNQRILMHNVHRIADIILGTGGFNLDGIYRALGKKVNVRVIADVVAPVRRKWEDICRKHKRDTADKRREERRRGEENDLWRTMFVFGQKPVTETVQKYVEDENVCETMYICKLYHGIITGKTNTPLSKWITAAKACGEGTISRFADGIQKDYRAVRNAIVYEYSNGLTEGCVNLIKQVKRTMFGRANIELLKAKVIYTQKLGCT